MIKFSKDYKNRNNVSSRVYVDVDDLSNEDVFAAIRGSFHGLQDVDIQDVKFDFDGDCDGPVYIIEITTADDETNGCYEMTFSQKKAHFQFHKNLTLEELIDTFDTGEEKEYPWYIIKSIILRYRKRRGLIME